MGAPIVDLLQAEMPIRLAAYDVAGLETGLVVVDVTQTFCAVGAGPHAPAAPDARIGRMVGEIDRLARRFVERRRPVLAFVDSRQPDAPGGDPGQLVPELAWLQDEPDVTVLRHGCVNGFVGAIEPVHHGTHGASRNRVVDWVSAHRLEAVQVSGACTDTCVMDFVLTMLSARNHGLMPTLRDIVVLEPATATYDLPVARAAELGLPATAAHPRLPAHHMGLYFMASRGALLAGELTGV